MKAKLSQIRSFLNQKTIAVIGASRDPKKFGTEAMNHLVSQGYHLIPVHPEAESIADIACVKSIAELGKDVQALFIALPKDKVDAILQQALDHGISNIWIQQFSDGPQTQTIIQASEANILTGRCIFMYTQPEGVHKFHEKLNKLFGSYAS